MAEFLKLRMLGDRIIVRPEPVNDMSPGGIYLPQTSQDPPVVAEVLAVGPGKESPATGEIVPVDVKVGDRILFTKYATSVTVDGEDLKALRESEVFAVFQS